MSHMNFTHSLIGKAKTKGKDERYHRTDIEEFTQLLTYTDDMDLMELIFLENIPSADGMATDTKGNVYVAGQSEVIVLFGDNMAIQREKRKVLARAVTYKNYIGLGLGTIIGVGWSFSCFCLGLPPNSNGHTNTSFLWFGCSWDTSAIVGV
ncbi:hypothetical protein ACFLT2_09935 [Acidobacteriota bacterium]